MGRFTEVDIPDNLKREYAKQVLRLSKASVKLGDEAVKRALKLLETTRKEVVIRLASAKGFEAVFLRELVGGLGSLFEDFTTKYGTQVKGDQKESFTLGQDLVDKPLEGVFGFETLKPRLPIEVLEVAQNFTTSLVEGLSTDALNQISQEVNLAVLSGKPFSQVINSIGRNLDDPSIFKSIADRSEAIARTEVMRVSSIATQRRLTQWVEDVPTLKKQWLSVIDGRTRSGHIIAHGQIVEVDEPFLVAPEVGDSREELMFPRDPSGSPENTVQCRCTHTPIIEEVELDAIQQRAERLEQELEEEGEL